MSLPLSSTVNSFLSACTPSSTPNVRRLQVVRVLRFINHSSFRSLEYPYADTPTLSVSLGFTSRRILVLIRSTDTTQLHNLQQQATTARIPRWKQREERAHDHCTQRANLVALPFDIAADQFNLSATLQYSSLDLCTHLSNNHIFTEKAQVNHQTY